MNTNLGKTGHTLTSDIPFCGKKSKTPNRTFLTCTESVIVDICTEHCDEQKVSRKSQMRTLELWEWGYMPVDTHKHTQICLRVGINVYTCAYINLRCFPSGSIYIIYFILSYIYFFIFNTYSLIDLELTQQAKLVGQKVPRIHLSSSPNHGIIATCQKCPAICVG